jgi:hypothetical protein
MNHEYHDPQLTWRHVLFVAILAVFFVLLAILK